jgi:hypothetical protein
LGHEKTPKPLWYRGFPVQYLFWLHNMVAGEIFVRYTEENFPLLLGREVRLFL